MPKRRRRTKRAGGDPRRWLLTAIAVAAAGLFLALRQPEAPSPARTRSARAARAAARETPRQTAQPEAGTSKRTSARVTHAAGVRTTRPHAEASAMRTRGPAPAAAAAQQNAAPPRPHSGKASTADPNASPKSAVVAHHSAFPAPNTRHPTPLPELDRGPATRPAVALTFDAGSSPAPTPGILHALKAANRRCTFFLTGEWTAHNPNLVRHIAEEGHELGNHTYSHPDLRRLSDTAVARELERADALVRHVAGRGTRPYFRPPFGARNGRVLREAARHGYRCVYWSTDSLDSVIKGITPRQIERRVLSRVQPGSIILMHCGSEATSEALPHLLTALRKRGYRVVTISELLRTGSARISGIRGDPPGRRSLRPGSLASSRASSPS